MVTNPPLESAVPATVSVKLVATGILLCLILVFFVTFVPSDPNLTVLFIRAMAEAGMVGALADWFAVEALFRHPLGIPIPHTALLPRNQRRAADNIARFIDEYFLVPEQLLKRIDEVNPAEKLANWAKDPAHAALLSREFLDVARYILRSQAEEGLGPKASRLITDSVARSVDTQLLSHEIGKALKGSAHSRILDNILLHVAAAVDDNRDQVSKLVQDRSRWWVASAVDKKVVSVLVDGVLSVLSELTRQDSQLRHDFEHSVTRMIEELENDGTLTQYLCDGIDAFTASDQFASALSELSRSVFDGASREMDQAPDPVIEIFSRALQDLCANLLADPELQSKLNARLQVAAKAVLTEIRPAVSAYVVRTISEWDTQMLVERIEAEVGRDLQFIRINGAVLGSIVGGMIFMISRLLTH